jgi:hypothetical protein
MLRIISQDGMSDYPLLKDFFDEYNWQFNKNWLVVTDTKPVIREVRFRPPGYGG